MLVLTKDDAKTKSKILKVVVIAIVVALTLNKTILIENSCVLVSFILKVALLSNPLNCLLVCV